MLLLLERRGEVKIAEELSNLRAMNSRRLSFSQSIWAAAAARRRQRDKMHENEYSTHNNSRTIAIRESPAKPRLTHVKPTIADGKFESVRNLEVLER